MNNLYEMMLITKPSLTEADEKKLMGKIEKILTDDGKIIKNSSLGKKQLSYRIKKETEGKYWLLDLDLPPHTANQSLAKLKMEEDILRFLLLRKQINKKKIVKETKKGEVKEKKISRRESGSRIKSGKKKRSK